MSGQTPRQPLAFRRRAPAHASATTGVTATATATTARPRRWAGAGLVLLACAVQADAAATYTLLDLSPITTDATTATPYQAGFVGSQAPYALGAKGEVLAMAWLAPTSLLSPTGPTAIQRYSATDRAWASVQTPALASGSFAVSSVMNSLGHVAGLWTAAVSTAATPYVLRVDGTGYTAPYPVAALGDAGWAAVNTFSGPVVDCNGTNQTPYLGDMANGGPLSAVGSLSVVAGFDMTQVRGINRSGQAVGMSRLARGNCLAGAAPVPAHAFVAAPGAAIKDLHSPSMPLNHSYAAAINAGGMAVGAFGKAWGLGGRAGVPIIFHAALWNTTTGAYTDLGHPTNAKVSSGLKGINAAGTVVGQEITYSGLMVYNWIEGTVAGSDHALVGDATGLQRLDTLTALPTGWRLTDATAVNDAGQILARAVDAQNYGHVVLLTPTGSANALPGAPTGLTATAAAAAATASAGLPRVDLAWTDNASNETAHTVEFCVGPNCSNFVQVASLAANVTRFSHTGLSAATTYRYRTRAQGAAGASAYSNVVSVATPAAASGPLAAPTGLTAKAMSSSAVTLAWADRATGETGYAVQRCRGVGCSSFQTVALLGANASRLTDTGLRRGTSFSYRVRATGALAPSAYTPTVSVVTLP